MITRLRMTAQTVHVTGTDFITEVFPRLQKATVKEASDHLRYVKHL